MSSDPKPGLDPLAVCTLPEGDLTARLAWVRETILPHALESERLTAGLAWEFPMDPALEERLDRWIELERSCCSSLTFERNPGRQPDRTRLEIRGVDPDAEVFRNLAIPQQPTQPRWRRVATAATTGLAGSLLVCCIVPMTAGALLGSAAAPLAGLDAPIPITLAAILGATAAWQWQSRTTRAATACGPEC